MCKTRTAGWQPTAMSNENTASMYSYRSILARDQLPRTCCPICFTRLADYYAWAHRIDVLNAVRCSKPYGCCIPSPPIFSKRAATRMNLKSPTVLQCNEKIAYSSNLPAEYFVSVICSWSFLLAQCMDRGEGGRGNSPRLVRLLRGTLHGAKRKNSE